MAFDINRFLNNTYEESFQTKRELVPEGDYVATIKGMPEFSAGKRPGTVMAKITFRLIGEDAEEAARQQNREELTVTNWMFIDVDEEDASIIKYGANQSIELGRLRAALGQNDPSRPWNPMMLDNAGPLLVKVSHRAVKDSEGQPTGEMADFVSKYARFDD